MIAEGRQAQEELGRQLLDELRQLWEAAGCIVARWGEHELSPAPYTERVGHDLVVQIDGAKAHLEDGWKEIKVGAMFSWDSVNPEAKP